MIHRMKLSEFELDVMQEVWRGKERSAPEVHRAVAQTRGVTYSTVKMFNHGRVRA